MQWSTSEPERRLGAYGFRLRGLDQGASLLTPTPATWPVLDIEIKVGAPPPSTLIGNDHAILRFPSGNGGVETHRDASTAAFTMTEPTNAHAIIHPYLPAVAAIRAHWLGLQSFHAGAFMTDEGAWGLIGAKGAGKSSTLAWLAMESHGIVTDDMVVVGRGPTTLAGPRCIDLRPDMARHLDTGENIGIIGVRERWRVTLPAVAPEVPLLGWVHLTWGDRVAFRARSASWSLQALFANRALFLPVDHPLSYLELAALPTWELTRPQGMANIAAVGEALLGLRAS